MFGYVSANPQMMTEAETNRYRAMYCGLCRCLGQRHGQLSRISLTYDMTFLIIFLGGMYEPREQEERFRCIVHPKDTHTAITTPITQYAADMNILLAYLNCMDNWKDDRNFAALLGSRAFKKGYEQARERYPRQWEVISREMSELMKLEAARCQNPELPANCFGRLLGELFVYDEKDRFARELRQYGYFLGKLVYLYDACMDFERDRKCGSYNPLAVSGVTELSGAEVRQMLTVYLSACTEVFERLPIVQDSDMIRNILYSGVWQEFHKKYEQPETGRAKE